MTARPSAWAAGLQLRCPQCGKGEVFQGYLKFRDTCRACGADFKAADAGDGPAVFVILIVGAIVAPLLIVLQYGLDLPGWLALTLTLLAAVVLCLALLPPFKSVLFAFQWKHKAREATSDDIE
ncbi:DUF983 domain-containing protein [Terricaulis sp.]|uniref:DUF983 domain-containing protein n=1 Tax=Terricaulis sp. TaxID=2768686 RepID=UPI002AC423CD|nr:DUF983 domain-containing protein [Terricaulis sp.]MDZ4693021.1 DUF983 domain-containing protein [Terricaulis sp.]